MVDQAIQRVHALGDRGVPKDVRPDNFTARHGDVDEDETEFRVAMLHLGHSQRRGKTRQTSTGAAISDSTMRMERSA